MSVSGFVISNMAKVTVAIVLKNEIVCSHEKNTTGVLTMPGGVRYDGQVTLFCICESFITHNIELKN